MRAVLPAAAVLLLAGAGIWALTRPDPPAGGKTPTVAVTSAAVTRGDIVARVQLPGVLGFDGSYSITSQLPPGVVTATARAGSLLGRGDRLFTVGAVSASLLYGPVPAYRPFTAGMADGDDVRELEANLAALGMDPYGAMVVDRHFSAATTAAIRRWQAARGLPVAARTGTLALGEVVFLPGRIRVGQILVGPGATAGPGARVLAATGTGQVVRLALTTDRRSQVHVGDPVEVSLPGSSGTVQGRVRQVGTVASAPASSQSAGQGGTQGSGADPATVQVTVTLIRPGRAVAGLDLAPVQVAITSDSRRGVLTVPVTALLARPGGGYQVAVLTGAVRRFLQVRPGLYDDDTGTVEVTGDGLNEGDRVEVPVS